MKSEENVLVPAPEATKEPRFGRPPEIEIPVEEAPLEVAAASAVAPGEPSSPEPAGAAEPITAPTAARSRYSGAPLESPLAAEPERAPESILTDSPRTTEPSNVSLRPVGFDVPRADTKGEVAAPRSSELRAQRRRLSQVVYGACGVILLVGGVRFARTRAHSGLSSANAAAAAAHPPASTANAANEPPGPARSGDVSYEWANGFPGEDVHPGAKAASWPAAPLLAEPLPTTGMLVLRKPAQPGAVWLDGTTVTDASTSVTCGAHEIKVRGWRRHAISVPCGGELRVFR